MEHATNELVNFLQPHRGVVFDDRPLHLVRVLPVIADRLNILNIHRHSIANL